MRLAGQVWLDLLKHDAADHLECAAYVGAAWTVVQVFQQLGYRGVAISKEQAHVRTAPDAALRGARAHNRVKLIGVWQKLINIAGPEGTIRLHDEHDVARRTHQCCFASVPVTLLRFRDYMSTSLHGQILRFIF